MIIETKYNLGDWVYIMSDNKVIKGQITTIKTMSEIDSSGSNPTTLGFYDITNYRFTAREDELYDSKEALLKSL